MSSNTDMLTSLRNIITQQQEKIESQESLIASLKNADAIADKRVTEHIIQHFSQQHADVKHRAITIKFETYVEFKDYKSAESIVSGYLAVVQSNPSFLDKFHDNPYVLELLIKNSTNHSFTFTAETIRAVEYIAKYRKVLFNDHAIQLQLLRLGNKDTLKYYDDIDFKPMISTVETYAVDYDVCEYMTKKYGVTYVKNNGNDSSPLIMLTNQGYIPIIKKYINKQELCPITYANQHIDVMVNLIDDGYKLFNEPVFWRKSMKLAVCLLRNKIPFNQQTISNGSQEHGLKLIRDIVSKTNLKEIFDELDKLRQSDSWYYVQYAYQTYDDDAMLVKIMNFGDLDPKKFEFTRGDYNVVAHTLTELKKSNPAQWIYMRHRYNIYEEDAAEDAAEDATEDAAEDGESDNLIEYLLDQILIDDIKTKNYRELFDILNNEGYLNYTLHKEYPIMYAIKNKDSYLVEKLIERGAKTDVEIDGKNLKWYVQEYANGDLNLLRILNLAPPSDIDALKKEIMILRDEVTGLKAMNESFKNKIVELTMMLSTKQFVILPH